MTSRKPAGDTVAGTRTETMRKGRQADSARRRQRVLSALDRATASGTEISASGIARAAGFSELGRCARNCLVRAYLWPPASLMALVTR
jgi:hypothetical protein